MIRLALLLSLLLGLSACTDDDLSQADFNEALDGEPSDPTSYEVTVVSCENDGEFIRYSWGLRNLSQRRQTFAFDPYLTNSAGEEEKKNRQLVAESVGPDEYVEWDGGEGGGERFPIGEVECRFEVVNSVLGDFRDEG